MNRLNSFTRINLESVSTSKGNQQKWFDGKYWYKSNFMGYEKELERCLDVLNYTFNKWEGDLWIQK